MEPADVFSATPPLTILVSALAAVLIAGTGQRRANLREFWSVAAGLVKLALVASMIPAVWAGRLVSQWHRCSKTATQLSRSPAMTIEMTRPPATIADGPIDRGFNLICQMRFGVA